MNIKWFEIYMPSLALLFPLRLHRETKGFALLDEAFAGDPSVVEVLEAARREAEERGGRRREEIALDVPWSTLQEDERLFLLFGSRRGRRKRPRGYKGVIIELEKAVKTAKKAATRDFLQEFQTQTTCEDCDGARLRPESRAVAFHDLSISTIYETGIEQARQAWARA